MLKQFGTFIAWISGSLAGIGAILYGLGFVATMAEDRLLGIGFAFAIREPEFYVERGGSLTMRTLIPAIGPVLVLVAFAAAFRWLSRQLDLAGNARLVTPRRLAQAAAPPLAAMVMLFVSLAGLVNIVGPALDVSGLLFSRGPPLENCDGAGEVAKAILSPESDARSAFFKRFAMHAGVVAGLGLIAWPHLLGSGKGLWLAIAGIAGFFALVGVPITYGILVAEKSAPEVWIEPPPNGGEERLRLLSRTNDSILIWLEDRRLLRWINAQQIETLTVGPGEPIIALSCPGPGSSAEGD